MFLTSDDLPYSSRFIPEDLFLDFATTLVAPATVSEITEVSEIASALKLWLGPDFELKTIYEDNSDDYTVGNLSDSHEKMEEAFDEAIKNYLRDPSLYPQVIIGLFASVGSPDDAEDKAYNIISYFWIDPSPVKINGEPNNVILNKFRIDIHKGKRPNLRDTGTSVHEPFNSTEMVSFWGLTLDELEAGETCAIRLLTLSVNPHNMMTILNWTQFPNSLVG